VEAEHLRRTFEEEQEKARLEQEMRIRQKEEQEYVERRRSETERNNSAQEEMRREEMRRMEERKRMEEMRRRTETERNNSAQEERRRMEESEEGRRMEERKRMEEMKRRGEQEERERQTVQPKVKNENAIREMREIIMKQSALGFWNLADLIPANLLGNITKKIQEHMPASAPSNNNDISLRLWTTAVVVEYLQHVFPTESTGWQMVVRKAKKYISIENRKLNSSVNWLAEAKSFVSSNC